MFAGRVASCMHISVFWLVTIPAIILFGVLRTLFRLPYDASRVFFFDPQDYFHYKNRPVSSVLPRSAENATFEPMLKHYIGVTQLLVTIAAASIAFGGGNGSQAPSGPTVSVAKVLLAWSVFYGVL